MRKKLVVAHTAVPSYRGLRGNAWDFALFIRSHNGTSIPTLYDFASENSAKHAISSAKIFSNFMSTYTGAPQNVLAECPSLLHTGKLNGNIRMTNKRRTMQPSQILMATLLVIPLSLNIIKHSKIAMDDTSQLST